MTHYCGVHRSFPVAITDEAPVKAIVEQYDARGVLETTAIVENKTLTFAGWGMFSVCDSIGGVGLVEGFFDRLAPYLDGPVVIREVGFETGLGGSNEGEVDIIAVPDAHQWVITAEGISHENLSHYHDHTTSAEPAEGDESESG